MAKIKLKGDYEALIDDDDFELVSQIKWHVSKIQHLVYASGSKGVLMHRLITGAKKGEVVDHINGNGLDNRRCNLRICTSSQNAMNQRKQNRQTSSKYKGVRLHVSGKWEARIRAFNVRKTVGFFNTEYEAACAYNEAALKTHKEFARLNEL